MRIPSFPTIAMCAAAAVALAACSPKYDWRDYSSPDAPFRAIFPGKPDTHTRSVNLDGMQVNMTMTAAQVDGTTFAVGTGVAPDAAKAEAALAAMKTALVRNIGAVVQSEAAGKASAASGASRSQSAAIDIVATGKRNGAPVRLIGHFESRDTRFYQVIVMGKENEVSKENVEMFMSSFKLQ